MLSLLTAVNQNLQNLQTHLPLRREHLGPVLIISLAKSQNDWNDHLILLLAHAKS